ncbi:MAG: histidine phosphatase family protein [Thermoplasmatota archaeon]
MQPTRLWFLRHGEPGGGMAGAFLGRTEADLSPLGRHQAEAVKEYLRDAQVDAVLASPRRRAKDTVAPLAAVHGIPVRPVAGFAEMDFGKWEGLHWDAILRLDRGYAEAWQADPAGSPPGMDGEGCDDFQGRIDAALASVLDEFRGRSVVLGAHAGTCRAILANILRRPYLEAFAFAQDYGCVNAAAWPEGAGAQIALTNFVPGPRSATGGD